MEEGKIELQYLRRRRQEGSSPEDCLHDAWHDVTIRQWHERIFLGPGRIWRPFIGYRLDVFKEETANKSSF